MTDVLVITPGHGSEWMTDAVIVDRMGRPNPRGRFVQASAWEYDGGWNMPDDYIGMPVTMTVPRRWVLRWESGEPKETER